MVYLNQPQETYYVYIFKCSNKAYYVGLTNNLLLRFQEHLDGIYTNCHTYDKRPLTLLYYETIPFQKEATEREKQLKSWSRKKKEALVARDYHKLQLLAECQNPSHNNTRISTSPRLRSDNYASTSLSTFEIQCNSLSPIAI